ncbi:MAG: CvpA family protein [Firmicutes bacterium]|nr:CvpA family protein [Bacillota bacterium]
MNWLLIILVLLAAGNMVWGFEKGFIRVMYSMLGWVVVLALAVWMTEPMEKWLNSMSAVHGTISGTFAAFFAALILTKLILLLLVRLMDLIAKLPLLKETNRFLGVLAGAGKGLLEVELVMLLITLGRNTEIGILMVNWIYESPVLTILYENNVVRMAVMALL